MKHFKFKSFSLKVLAARIRNHLRTEKKEISLYLIFGVLTTVVNIGLFNVLFSLKVNYLIANLVALITAKAFAYVTNKFFVYKSRTQYAHETLSELLRFGLARGFTGFVDYFGMILLVELLHQNPRVSKYLLQVVVIALNYLLGRKVVFVRR